MRCFVLAVLLNLIACASGGAFEAPALGIGPHPCSEWTGSKEQAAWVLGYYTRANVFPNGMGYFFRYDEKNLVNWQTQYCRDHPKASIASAPLDLIGGLRKSYESHKHRDE